MACKRYQGALSDLAAGGPAAAEVEAHLQMCEGCRAELLALRQALTAVDQELARLRLAEPSSDLEARIRAAAAESVQAAPGWRSGWGLMLTAAAAALIVASVFVARRSPRHEPQATVVDRAPAYETPRAMPAPETVVAGRPRRPQPVETPSPASSSTRTGRVREPEVLVPAGEAEALVRLAASLRRRSVTPDSLLVADLTAPLAEAKLPEIRPLEIVPLDPAESSGAK
jgi:hypothetical protein